MPGKQAVNTPNESSADLVLSEQAIEIFASIVAERPYDTSRVMAMLKPSGGTRKPPKANKPDNEGNSDNVFDDEEEEDEESSEEEEEEEIDLANFGANKATDIFILKFLLCSGEKVRKGS